MDIDVVIEHVRHLADVRADGAARLDQLESALRDVVRVESWLAGVKATITSRLSAQVSFPEKTIADCTRGSGRDAIKERERAGTLDATPAMADALDDARVTAAHVDALTASVKQLDGTDQRAELIDRVEHGLVDVAAVASVEEWRRRLAMEVKAIQRDDGMARLERQRRATSLRTWTDGEGMWCLSGRFDPLTGARLAARIDATREAVFAEGTPDTCPADPVDKQRHLGALALASLIEGAAGGRPGRPEFVVVVDASQSDGAGGPLVDWGIPVDVPFRVLADLAGTADVHAVVVRNGVVLHAPGEFDLGRSTRLASRAQRRALRGLYATCAIPGCGVRYDRCKLHHVIWWRHGGRTDLANLVPLCVHHHSKVHDAGWDLTLGANRELTIRFPDGTIHNTGPPSRHAA